MKTQKKIEVVIPIYNEEDELEKNIRKLLSFLNSKMKGYDCIINIADNASTDNSLKIARKLAGENKKIKYIHLNKKGRGRAIKKAWNNSKADYLAYMDVDLSTDLKSFPNLISALKENDIAIGSRLMSKSKVIGRTLKREILSRIYNILIKLFFQTQFSDAQCGFKAINKKIAQNLLPSIEDNAWFFDSELLIIGEKLGYKIHEEPVFWIDNPGSTVRVLKTVQGDLEGLLRLFIHRPWKDIRRKI